MAKTYKQLQDDAELLGIAKNQSTEKLVAAIAEMTSVKAFVDLRKEKIKCCSLTLESQDRVEELTKNLAEVNEINTKLGEAKPVDTPDLDIILKPVVELLGAQLGDKEVYTDCYKTGLANGLTMAVAAVNGVTLADDELIKPITQTNIKGAKVLTGRQALIKEAGKYITIRCGVASLRSGLSTDDVKEADEIMKRLGVKEGTYAIPAE